MRFCKNLEGREIYEEANHPICTLALVYERVHCYSKLSEVRTDDEGQLYAVVEEWCEGGEKFEERFPFSMDDVQCVPGIEIGLYTDIVHFLCCETVCVA